MISLRCNLVHLAWQSQTHITKIVRPMKTKEEYDNFKKGIAKEVKAIRAVMMKENITVYKG